MESDIAGTTDLASSEPSSVELMQMMFNTWNAQFIEPAFDGLDMQEWRDFAREQREKQAEQKLEDRCPARQCHCWIDSPLSRPRLGGMILRVTQFGEPILREKGALVTEFNDELKQFAADMLDTMYDEEGIGLAAQQVNVGKQMFVMDLQLGDRPVEFSYELDGKTPPLDLIMPQVVINPQIFTKEPRAPYEEGCLSFPGIRGEVVRDIYVEMKFQDVTGAEHFIKCDGLLARVILHENDHCQGVLFIDHMTPQVLRPLETKIKKLKRATRDWLKSYG